MNAIAIRDSSAGLTSEQIQLIKDTIAKEATDDELRQFIAVCNRLGLDPFAKQIYLVRRFDKNLKRMVAQSQVAIDGFRVVAERTGQYRGQTAPQWCGWDGVWRDVWLDREPPAAARVGVWREGYREPLIRTANLTSYVQTTKEGQPAAMWRTMPEVMLLKCAEAQALRAAFPNELGRVYTPDEMGQADNEAPPAIAPVVALRAPKAEEPTPPLEPSEQQTMAQVYGGKLRALKTEGQMVEWLALVWAHGFEKSVRGHLWRMFQHRCLEFRPKLDPNDLAGRAAEIAHAKSAQNKEEVAPHG